MEQKISLIDRLYEMMGCEYLSSMKEPQLKGELLEAIRHIDVERYTFQQWSKALSYLFEEPVQIESETQLQQFLARQSALWEDSALQKNGEI